MNYQLLANMEHMIGSASTTREKAEFAWCLVRLWLQSENAVDQVAANHKASPAIIKPRLERRHIVAVLNALAVELAETEVETKREGAGT